MTLHWWMHWFWITSLLALLLSGTALAAPQAEELQQITTDPHSEQKQADRQGRAMYFSKPQPSTKPTPINSNITDTERLEVIPNTTPEIEIAHPSIQWTLINQTEAENITHAEPKNNNATTDTHLDSLNVTKKRNLTRPDVVKDGASVEVSESRIVTEKPLSLETTLLQTRIPPNVESYRRVDNPESGMDTGAIAGISFAAVVVAALAGSTAFVLYRRRYLNKPQTLNDKCSNPDSSGYLDDSTIRDNSEEMYSLDNDSFLNSLEAMTIQNYWTDTVKHTKLNNLHPDTPT